MNRSLSIRHDAVSSTGWALKIITLLMLSFCLDAAVFQSQVLSANIEILTYTEVDSVKGEAGDFKVTLTKKPRYINEDKCTGCMGQQPATG